MLFRGSIFYLANMILVPTTYVQKIPSSPHADEHVSSMATGFNFGLRFHGHLHSPFVYGSGKGSVKTMQIYIKACVS